MQVILYRLQFCTASQSEFPKLGSTWPLEGFTAWFAREKVFAFYCILALVALLSFAESQVILTVHSCFNLFNPSSLFTMAYSCDRFLIFFLAALAAEAVNMHTIKVGFAGSPIFDPATTMADVDDVVVFEFYSTNHSIARGEYVESKACGSDSCNPCVPYELIHPKEPGFHSDNFITERVSNNPDVTPQSYTYRAE